MLKKIKTSTANLLDRWDFPVEGHEETKESLDNLSEVEPNFPADKAEAAKPSASRPIQPIQEGVGALFHRRYWVEIAGARKSAEALMQLIQHDPNPFTPQELAHFKRTIGDANNLAVGDEFHISISSPWDAPVRVIDVTSTSFTFVTLAGHLEAGEITFRISTNDQLMTFEIVSWARSKDLLVQLAYEGFGIAKVAQTGMWTYFCERVVEASGGTRVGDVQVMTQKVQFDG